MNNIEAAKICLERSADLTHALKKLHRMVKRQGTQLSVPGNSEEEEAAVMMKNATGDLKTCYQEEAEIRKRTREFVESLSSAGPPMA
jgi:hypothetical protein